MGLKKKEKHSRKKREKEKGGSLRIQQNYFMVS